MAKMSSTAIHFNWAANMHCFIYLLQIMQLLRPEQNDKFISIQILLIRYRIWKADEDFYYWCLMQLEIAKRTGMRRSV